MTILYIEAGIDETLPLKDQMTIHLRHNHRPAFSASLVPVAVRAVKKARKGEWDKRVRLPEDFTFGKSKLMPVRDMVKVFRLERFIEKE